MNKKIWHGRRWRNPLGWSVAALMCAAALDGPLAQAAPDKKEMAPAARHSAAPAALPQAAPKAPPAIKAPPANTAPSAIKAPPAISAPPAVTERQRQAQLEKGLDGLLSRHFGAAKVALALWSEREGRWIYRRRADEPFIAASNIKLVTSYAALQTLSPNHSWETGFFKVDIQDGPGGEKRQGLLVRSSGDPSYTYADMIEAAASLRAHGLSGLPAGLFYEQGPFDGSAHPAVMGDSLGDQAWAAPFSAYMVNQNAVAFWVGARKGWAGQPQALTIQSQTLAPPYNLMRRFSPGPHGVIVLRQHGQQAPLDFTLSGKLPDKKVVYEVHAALDDPLNHYFAALASALAQAGVEVGPDTGPLPPEAQVGRRLYLHRSPPLRQVIATLNKDSNNVAAEALVRAMGRLRKESRVSTEDGLAVVMERMEQDFPGFGQRATLKDGSGLSRQTTATASLLVEVLRRGGQNQAFGAEYVSSLSRAAWDGTLHYRKYDPELEGRLRAKSGTLKEVQNLTGILEMEGDSVIFSFLVNKDARNMATRQQAQDQAMGEIFEILTKWEAQKEPNAPLSDPSLPSPAATPQ